MNPQDKLRINRAYGKSAHPQYPDNPHHRRYTPQELFRIEFNTRAGDTLHICQECGAAVALMWSHAEWHNKIADL